MPVVSQPPPLMKILALFAAVSAAILFTGCTHSIQYVRYPVQSRPLEKPSKARIYLVRAADSKTGSTVEVIDGNTVIGMTSGAGFLCWERAPGETVLISNSLNRGRLPLRVSAGQVYYVRQSVD